MKIHFPGAHAKTNLSHRKDIEKITQTRVRTG